MSFRGQNFIWAALGLGVLLPLSAALVFEVWSAGELPRGKPAPPPPAASARTSPPPATESPADSTPAPLPTRPVTSEPEPPKSVWNTPLPNAMMQAPFLKVEGGVLPQEAAVLAILGAGGPESAQAQALFNLLGQVPEETLASTAEQAVRRLRDRDYASVARPWIVDPKTHGQVLGALMADLMQRPDAIALPTLAEIAQTPGHPLAPSAHDNLTLLLGRDMGADWDAWHQAILQKIGAP